MVFYISEVLENKDFFMSLLPILSATRATTAKMAVLE
jgi:hypothetical protein